MGKQFAFYAWLINRKGYNIAGFRKCGWGCLMCQDEWDNLQLCRPT